MTLQFAKLKKRRRTINLWYTLGWAELLKIIRISNTHFVKAKQFKFEGQLITKQSYQTNHPTAC
jgi:hypothetical protein